MYECPAQASPVRDGTEVQHSSDVKKNKFDQQTFNMVLFAILEILFLGGFYGGYRLIMPTFARQGFFNPCNITNHTFNYSELELQILSLNESTAETFTLMPLYVLDESATPTSSLISSTLESSSQESSRLTTAPMMDDDINYMLAELIDEDNCNDNQREWLHWVGHVTQMASGFALILIGWVFDRTGTFKLRLLTIIVFCGSTLVMTFIVRSKSKYRTSWMMFLAWPMLAGSSITFFLTNIQVSNAVPRWRNTLLMLSYCALQTSTYIMILIELTSSIGLRLQTSFMFMMVGMIPFLITTIAFLPRKKVRWPPVRGSRESFFPRVAALLMQNCPSDERAKMVSERVEQCNFWDHIKSPIFTCHLLWLCVTKLQMYFFNEVFEWKDDIFWHHIIDNSVIWTRLCTIPLTFLACGLIGLFLDFYTRLQELHNVSQRRRCVTLRIMCAVLGCCLLLIVFGCFATYSGHYIPLCYVTVVLECLLNVIVDGVNAIVLATFFPYQYFGRLLGVTLAAQGLTSAVAHPLLFAVKQDISALIYVNWMWVLFSIGLLIYPLLLYTSRNSNTFAVVLALELASIMQDYERRSDAGGPLSPGASWDSLDLEESFF